MKSFLLHAVLLLIGCGAICYHLGKRAADRWYKTEPVIEIAIKAETGCKTGVVIKDLVFSSGRIGDGPIQSTPPAKPREDFFFAPKDKDRKLAVVPTNDP